MAIIAAVAYLTLSKYQSGDTGKPVSANPSPQNSAKLSFHLSGKVIESDTGRPIVSANLQADGRTVHSDRLGGYRLDLAPGRHIIKISADGFRPLTDKIYVKKDWLDFNFKLNMTKVGAYYPANMALPAVKPQVISRGNPNEKKVALTIDDGWNADDRILDLLEKNHIKATVFVIGGRGVGESHPDWIRRMDRDGFEVSTHTFDHYVLTNLSDQAIDTDILKGQEVLSKVTNKKYPYMRPSGGGYSRRVLNDVAGLGYKMVMWSNELGDTKSGITADQEVKNVLSHLSNGDIILCHFGGHHTYDALARLVPEILRRGYKITTVTDVMEGVSTEPATAAK